MSKKKQAESIWTSDITPHVVNFLTTDITPDFSSELWTKDITHHVIATMAVFGLIVSAFVTTLGVAAVGVNVEVAFAQRESVVAQTAALAMAQNQLAPASTTTDRPHMEGGVPAVMAQIASSAPMFCPQITRTIMRGNHEATTTGDIGQLQQFMAEHFNMDKKDVVTGFFGSTTQGLLMRFQEEQGIPPAPQAGPLTRAAIARLCNPNQGKGDDHRDDHMGSTSPMMGSTTRMMGSTTAPMPPHRDGDVHPAIGSTSPMMGSSTERHSHPMIPVPPPQPVSYIDNGSNAAAVIDAVSEISDGYAKLLGAGLSLLGLN